MSVVNTGGELPGLTLSNGRGRSQAETLPLALRKNSGAITLLQEGSLLTLAVLLSSYGSLNSLVSSLCASFKAIRYEPDVQPVTFCDLIGAAIYLQWGQVSLVPRPSLAPVFDRLQHTEGLGTRLGTG